jgi:periplasmic protein TonB
MGVTASPLPSPPPAPRHSHELFSESLVGIEPPAAGRRGLPVSIALHLLVGGALVLVPALWPSEMPPTDGIRAVLYDPPPPPPPPLALGSDQAKKQPAQPVTPEVETKVQPREDKFVAPVEEMTIEPEQKLPAVEQAGAAEGVSGGDPDGMVEGVEGGTPGGVPGGVLGGVLGGTGTGLSDYDRPPNVLRQPRPVYPTEAAVKRIEGKVIVEMVVDTNGHVLDARVIESIPLLDQAAIRNVYEWVFSPAMKEGRPVKSIVHGVVTFRLL